MSREFDVVVWGATGFTGRLVAEYLCEQYGVNKDVKWAIAGRNPQKLAAVKEELTQRDRSASELSVLLGDSHGLARLSPNNRHPEAACARVRLLRVPSPSRESAWQTATRHRP